MLFAKPRWSGAAAGRPRGADGASLGRAARSARRQGAAARRAAARTRVGRRAGAAWPSCALPPRRRRGGSARGDSEPADAAGSAAPAAASLPDRPARRPAPGRGLRRDRPAGRARADDRRRRARRRDPLRRERRRPSRRRGGWSARFSGSTAPRRAPDAARRDGRPGGRPGRARRRAAERLGGGDGRRAARLRGRRQGRATARNLRGYGINVDLAPVLDVARRGGAIAARAGASARTPATGDRDRRRRVRRRAAATAASRRRPSTSPGSAPPGSTPTTPRRGSGVSARAAARRRRGARSRPSLEAGGELVMLGLATYPASRGPPGGVQPHGSPPASCAAGSASRGSAITDSLDAAAATRLRQPRSGSPLAAAGAGNDLLLYGDWRTARRGRPAAAPQARRRQARPRRASRHPSSGCSRLRRGLADWARMACERVSAEEAAARLHAERHARPAARPRPAAGVPGGPRRARRMERPARLRRPALGRDRALQPRGRQLPLGLLRPVRAGAARRRAAISFAPADFRRFAPLYEEQRPRVMCTVTAAPDADGYCRSRFTPAARSASCERAARGSRPAARGRGGERLPADRGASRRSTPTASTSTRSTS